MAAHQLQPVRARCAGRRLAARIHASALPVAPCLSRRAAAAAAAALALFPRPASAEDVGASEEPTAVPPAEPAAPDLPAPPPALQLATWSSATLAFSFEYPLSATDGRPLSWLPTRDAARYSDAAPLSADARQARESRLRWRKGAMTAAQPFPRPSTPPARVFAAHRA